LFFRKKRKIAFKRKKYSFAKKLSSRKKKRNLDILYFIKKFLYIIIFLIVISSLPIILFYLYSTGFFNIKEKNIIAIRDVTYLDAHEIENFIKKSLHDNKYNKNIFAFNTKKAEQEILEKFTEIKTVIIKKIPPESLKIFLETRKIRLRLFTESGKNYLIDSAGVVSKMHQVNKENKITNIRVDFLSKEPKFRDIIFSSQEVREITDLSWYFEDEFMLKIKNIDFLTSINEVHINLQKNNLKIKMNKGNYKIQLLKLDLVFDKISENPDRFGQLEYIDLRIENKAYCK